MKIEAMETVKHHPHYLSEGDIVTVPDDVGQFMVNLGWCKNVETGEIGDRVPGVAVLDIQDSVLGVADDGGA